MEGIGGTRPWRRWTCQNPDNAFYIDMLGYGAVAAFVAWVAYYMGRDKGREEERR